MTRRTLERWGLRRGSEYELDVYHTPGPLQARLTAQPDAYHLLLLDIQLNGASGLELATFLRENRIRASVLYITAYQDCIKEAFHTHALDFLTKPVDEQKLAAALDWDYHENYRPEPPVLQTSDGVIPLDDILYLEPAQHKVAAHLPNGVRIIRGSLSSLEGELPPHRFCRSHHSFLVNLSHVAKLTRSSLTLDSGDTIPVSRSAYHTLTARYIAYLKTRRR